MKELTDLLAGAGAKKTSDFRLTRKTLCLTEYH